MNYSMCNLTCLQCGRIIHKGAPYFSYKNDHGPLVKLIAGPDIVKPFCSEGCMHAHKQNTMALKAEKEQAEAERQRQQLAKEHENARKTAKKALKVALKNVEKWEKIAERIGAAIESDDLKELKASASKALNDWVSMILGLLVILGGGAIWYYFFR